MSHPTEVEHDASIAWILIVSFVMLCLFTSVFLLAIF
jgi:hypothetical protein